MIHTFWLVQGTAVKNWYSTESLDDTHNSVLSDWQTVDRLLTYCGEVNLVKCKDGYFTKSVVTKSMTVAKPYYTATKPAIEVKPVEVKEVKTMTTKSIIWNQIKETFTWFNAKELKLTIDKTYTQATKEDLQQVWEMLIDADEKVNYELAKLQEEIKGEGVNESLGEVDGGSLQPTLINDSSNDSEINSSETLVNYIVTLTDYPQVVVKSEGNTPKELSEVTEEQLLDSLYSDKVTAEMMFPGSYYKVIEVNPVNIRQELMKHFNLEQDSSVATVTSDNFKGIPVEHFNFKHEAYIDSVLKDTTGVLISKYLGTHAVSFNDGEQRKSDITLLEAVKLAKQWLGVKQEQVPSTEEYIQPFNYSLELAKLKSLSRQEFMTLIQEVQHSNNFSSYYIPKSEVFKKYMTENEWCLTLKKEVENEDDSSAWLKLANIENCFSEAGNYHSQMQLTPKLYLFSLMTDYVFLMECFLELTTYFFNLSSSVYDANHQLYLTWNAICSICFKRYVLMPSKGDDTYITLLRISNQAMKQSSLERKSIYA